MRWRLAALLVLASSACGDAPPPAPRAAAAIPLAASAPARASTAADAGSGAPTTVTADAGAPRTRPAAGRDDLHGVVPEWIVVEPRDRDVRYGLVLRMTDCSGLRPNEDCVWGHTEVYGSLDAGHTWSKRAELPPGWGAPQGLAFGDDGSALVVTMAAGRPRYVSRDQGVTWSEWRADAGAPPP